MDEGTEGYPGNGSGLTERFHCNDLFQINNLIRIGFVVEEPPKPPEGGLQMVKRSAVGAPFGNIGLILQNSGSRIVDRKYLTFFPARSPMIAKCLRGLGYTGEGLVIDKRYTKMQEFASTKKQKLMKKNLLTIIIVATAFTACDVLQEVVKETTNINAEKLFQNQLWNSFNQKSPISTSFNDAVYEAEYLHDFEPEQSEYRPLDIQPKATTGGYVLRSGLYTMDAKSFCLRGYTYGPSMGDGHLYAPMKGKKADLVRSIIERYGDKPEIPQQNIQVLLWAIIAGADMNTLGEQHSRTLNQLFTVQELLEFQGKDLLRGFADNHLEELKKMALNNASPKLMNLLEADNKIRAMVQYNKSFQEIEQIAIIAGVAPPEDKIREVSKGRWSYHPDGFFVRFFPNGYAQTRVDVFVPFEGDLSFDERGKPRLIKNDFPRVNEVVFNLATTVAVPANQSSQKIGISHNSGTPSKNLKIKFYAYPIGTKVILPDNSSYTSLSGHIYVGFFIDDKLQVVKGFGPDGKSYWESSALSEETHLVSFAEKKFEVGVTPLSYNKAININKFGYFLGVNDCVSYADDVADEIGLNTPSLSNAVATPMGFLEYLIEHN